MSDRAGTTASSTTDSSLAGPPHPEPLARLIRETEEQRRRAYETTNSDEEAAALLGMNPLTFKDWRASRGYAIKNPKPGNRPSPEELECLVGTGDASERHDQWMPRRFKISGTSAQPTVPSRSTSVVDHRGLREADGPVKVSTE